MKKFRMISILAILSSFVVNCPKGKKDDNTGLLLFLLSSGSNASASATAPTVTSFAPSTGTVGTTVIITGTNFSSTLANNTVKFNGVTATATSASTTSITVTVPTGATTGKITVTVDSQAGTSSTDFTVTTTTSTCSTSSTNPTTLTAGTAASNIIIANGDVCYYAFTPSATDIYSISTSQNSNSDGSSISGNDVNMYVSYGDTNVTGNPTTATITATTYPGSDTDWAAFKQTTSTAESLYLHNVASVKHIIALHAKSCGGAGCSINLSASAMNASTTSCGSINSSFSLSATIESGASISGFLNTTNNCVYRLAMKTSTTNSYSVTGLTKDLDLYLGALGSTSSTAEFSSTASGTTSEAINTKTSTAGSYRYIQVSPYSSTNCSTGGNCSFTLGVTTP